MDIQITQADLVALFESDPMVKLKVENIALRRMLKEKECCKPVDGAV